MDATDGKKKQQRSRQEPQQRDEHPEKVGTAAPNLARKQDLEQYVSDANNMFNERVLWGTLCYTTLVGKCGN